MITVQSNLARGLRPHVTRDGGEWIRLIVIPHLTNGISIGSAFCTAYSCAQLINMQTVLRAASVVRGRVCVRHAGNAAK